MSTNPAALAASRDRPLPLAAIPRDEEGFLLDAGDWYPALAEAIAAEEGQPLEAEHREVVRYIREHFDTTGQVPEARRLLKHLEGQWGKEKGTRRYLYRLFPRGYGQVACKIAGMRKPRKLMLDV